MVHSDLAQKNSVARFQGMKYQNMKYNNNIQKHTNDMLEYNVITIDNLFDMIYGVHIQDNDCRDVHCFGLVVKTS